MAYEPIMAYETEGVHTLCDWAMPAHAHSCTSAIARVIFSRGQYYMGGARHL